MTTEKLIATGLTLIVANVLWQVLASQDWHAAAERSFFQSAALFIVWLNLTN